MGTVEGGMMCFDFWVQASSDVSPRRGGYGAWVDSGGLWVEVGGVALAADRERSETPAPWSAFVFVG
eukprot:scaffold101125_cov20-Attheya_sp.AAC.1